MKTYEYWLQKLRGQMTKVAGAQLVQIAPAPVQIQYDMLQTQNLGAKLKLPSRVVMTGTIVALLYLLGLI